MSSLITNMLCSKCNSTEVEFRGKTGIHKIQVTRLKQD